MSVLVDHQLLQLTKTGKPALNFDQNLKPECFIQPASLDLPLAPQFYTVAAEPALGEDQTVQKYFLSNYRGNVYDFRRMDEPFIQLAPGQLYLFEAAVQLDLPTSISATANPKSSSGRNFLHCKVICEDGPLYDTIPAGYQGRLYVLVTPRVYPVRFDLSETLVQLRFRNGPLRYLRPWELEMVNRDTSLTIEESTFVEEGLALHLNLNSDPALLVAHKMGRTLSLDERGTQKPHLYFWDKPLDGRGIAHLEPADSALASSCELVRIPPMVCAEMTAMDPRYGEVRYHDAGFFDPGFGYNPNKPEDGANVTCEITNIGPSSVQLAHNRIVGALRFENLDDKPKNLYGFNNSYQFQRGITLAKQFAPWLESRQRKSPK